MNSRSSYRITSPTDLLALVPSVLGFHPQDSLVLVVTAGDGGNLHARVDLSADSTETAEALRTLLMAVSRSRVREVVLIAYSDDELLSEGFVDLLVGDLESRDVEVVCAIRADGQRWYSLECGPTCCPVEGVAYDLASHPITAQSVLEGRVTFDSRQDLADSLVGTDLDTLDAVTAAADEAVRRSKAATRHPLGMEAPEAARTHLVAEGLWVRERVRRFVATSEPLDDQEVGRLVAAMADIEVRDVAWAEMTRFNSPTHVELWRDVVRRTPRHLLAAPAALLGFAAWLAGDGALAWCAVERCQGSEPDYTLAGLIAQALTGAVHPSTWQPIAPGELPLFAG